MKFYNVTCVLAAASSAYCMIMYLVKYGLRFSGNEQGNMDTEEGKVRGSLCRAALGIPRH
jgi:hypothetical protein